MPGKATSYAHDRIRLIYRRIVFPFCHASEAPALTPQPSLQWRNNPKQHGYFFRNPQHSTGDLLSRRTTALGTALADTSLTQPYG